jgi:hypothetical protein
MNSIQKQAWLTVTLAAICAVGFGILCPIFGPVPAISAFGLFGITGLGPLFWKKDRIDERDQAIFRRASLIAFATSYLVFVMGCMGTWTIGYCLQNREQISVHLPPLITGAGGIAFFFTQALAVLILYRSRVEADHG